MDRSRPSVLITCTDTGPCHADAVVAVTAVEGSDVEQCHRPWGGADIREIVPHTLHKRYSLLGKIRGIGAFMDHLCPCSCEAGQIGRRHGHIHSR